MRRASLVLFVSISFVLGASTALAGPVVEAVLQGPDYNNDGNGDLTLEAAGKVQINRMQGSTSSGNSSVTKGAFSNFVDSGDVNGDGNTDLGFSNATNLRLNMADATGSNFSTVAFLSLGASAWVPFAFCLANDDDNADSVEVGAPGTGGEGFVRIRTLSGGMVLGTGFRPTAGGNWKLVACVDVNEDGRQDLIFEGQAGTGAAGFIRIDLLASNGTSAQAQLFIGTAGGNFGFTVVGRFGSGNIAYTGMTGTGAAGLLRFDVVTSNGGTGAMVSGSSFANTAGGAFTLFGLADVDGDGTDDRVLENLTPGNQTIRIDRSTGGQFFLPNGGGSFLLGSLVDTDGDGQADIQADGDGFARIQVINPTATGAESTGFISNEANILELRAQPGTSNPSP